MTDEVPLQEKYEMLQEKYKRKSERVSQLLKTINNLQDEIGRWEEAAECGYKVRHRYNILASCMENNIYKVCYQVLSTAKVPLADSEIIKAPHARVAAYEMELKSEACRWEQYKLISVTKIA